MPDWKEILTHWKTLLGLLILFLAVAMGWSWMWGVLFLYWLIPSILTRQVFFIELIQRNDDPILYWVIVTTWFVLSLLMLLEPLIWEVS